MNSIENEVIENYTKNLAFLEQRYPSLYKKIVDLNLRFEVGIEKEKYALEYKDNKYFDIVLSDGSFLYGRNTNTITNEILNNLDTSPASSTFNTLHKDFKKLGLVYEYANSIFDYIEENKTKEISHNNIPKFIFLRTLLGLHIQKVINKLSVKECFIYESDLEIFRLSLFTTKYFKIAEQTKITFCIAQDLESFKRDFYFFFNDNFNTNYSIKYYSFETTLLEHIQSIISTSQANLLDFARKLNIYSQIIDNINSSYMVIDFNNLKELFKDKKVILLGSGPSLDDSIDWIKENQNKFIVLSVGANLKMLQTHNIKVDFICEIHPEKDILDNYKGLDKDYFDDVIFLSSTQVPLEVFNFFNPKNIFLYLSNGFVKPHLGMIEKPSVGNHIIDIALNFGSKEVYLMGLDFAFTKSGLTHSNLHIHKTTVENMNNSDDMQEQTIYVKGNFEEIVQTNTLFFSFLESASSSILKNSTSRVYNISNGAFIENTTPIRTKDIGVDSDYDKKELKTVFLDKLKTNSEEGFSQKDIDSLLDIIKQLEVIVNTKYNQKTTRSFINSILVNEAIGETYRDLVINYLRNVMHYIDGFLNNKAFNHKKQTKHLSNLTELLFDNFIKLSKDYKRLLENIVNQGS
jgi:hypothetical protein